MKSRMVIATLLTASSLLAISQNNMHNDGNEIVNKKNTDILQDKDNPFYPKYLQKNIESAVEVLVKEKLKEKKKRKDDGCSKQQQSKKNKHSKRKKAYQKIPNNIVVKSLSKNAKGEFVLITDDSKVLKKGVSIYGGIIKDITTRSVILERRENGVKKQHYVRFTIVF